MRFNLTRLIPLQTGNDLSVAGADGVNIPRVLSVDDVDHVTNIWNTHTHGCCITGSADFLLVSPSGPTAQQNGLS